MHNIQVLCLFCMISDAISPFQSGFMPITRDEANFAHFKCFFLSLFPGHQVPTPTLSSSKEVSRVIARNSDHVMVQIFLFYVTNMTIIREKYELRHLSNM